MLEIKSLTWVGPKFELSAPQIVILENRNCILYWSGYGS